MRERISKQRRDTALQLRSRLADPQWRSDAVKDSEGVTNIVVALWNDQLSRVMTILDEVGGDVNIVARRPGGGLVTLRFRSSARPGQGELEQMTAAPESTLGMLLECVMPKKPGETYSFDLRVAQSPLRRVEFDLVS